MFSGLNRLIKYILPKRLFYRALIIVAAPTIILQLIITIVFYDSIWIKVNKNITRSLVTQLKTIQEVYANDKKNLDFFTDSYKNNFNFEIGISQEVLPGTSGERKFSPMDRSLRRELKSAFGNNNYWFSTLKFKNAVEIKIKSNDNNDVLDFVVPKEMISASSVRLFVLWTTLPSILLVIIALIFLKNQTKPLVKLARAAERFGKGDYVNNFRASGSLEIRKAAFEFDRMAKRINRHLNQRAEMLSGISHDLRTPLTRIKLQLAMLKQKDLSEKMSKDIDEMEKMLNDYLQFAKTQVQEDTSKIDLTILFNSIKKEFNNEKLNVYNKDEIKLVGRPIALKRSFQNIIQNGLSYGNEVFIDIQKRHNRVLIIIEDDGPGIPEDQYRNVFKPFFRLDKSRSLNKSGVGLGLAIVEDIINSHGGNIQLGESKHKGLQVKISLPF
jgi:two-component system, OmpR family, osmolarity sensor histidine kinase EnvZ